MTSCVNPQCRAQHPDAYNFCPVCGADCRPPAFRGRPVTCMDHKYQGLGDFCSTCGSCSDLNRTNAIVFDQGLKKKAFGFMIAGGVVLVAALVLHWVISGFWGAPQVLVDQAEAGKSLRDPIAKHRPDNPYTGFVVLAALGLMGYGGYLYSQAKIDGQSA